MTNDKEINIQVMSEREIKKIKQFPQNACIISIQNPEIYNRPLPFPAPHITLFFEDTEDDTGIDEPQAVQIAKFVQYQIEKGNTNIIVHCEMGISRSSGIAAAILQKYTRDVSEIVDNPAYCVNGRCFEYVCKALDCNISDDDIKNAVRKSQHTYLTAKKRF